jgi:GH24 family phage-related lysozyme (muramidase)
MNERLRKLIKSHEGFSLIPYKCPAGFNSIGWGWNFDSTPLPDDVSEYMYEHGKITVEMAERLLDIAISVALENCQKLYPAFDLFSEHRKNVLCDYVFTVGYNAALQWTAPMRAESAG